MLRVDRPGFVPTGDLLTSHKSSIALDLKDAQSQEILLSLIQKTDVLIDPFRPGVLEKLGLDPETVLLKSNPRLIVVRLTGFRRDGKYSAMAGHDINYLAVSGVLSLFGPRNMPPSPPQNILGDFAGGGHTAFTGILLALMNRQADGRGQVVESNMVDGVSYLATFPRLLTQHSLGNDERGNNTFDGGCPYYSCYECADQGKYMSVGCMEPQFYQKFLKGLGVEPGEAVPDGLVREDKRAWPFTRELFARRFRTKTRKEWEAIFDGTDACCTPVFELGELQAAGYDQRPIVGLSKTPAKDIESPYEGKALQPGERGEEALKEWMSWKNGREYAVNAQGAFVKRVPSQL